MFKKFFGKDNKTTTSAQPTRVTYEVVDNVPKATAQPLQITAYGFTATPPDPIYIGWNQNSVETVTDKLNAIAAMVGTFTTRKNNLEKTAKAMVEDEEKNKSGLIPKPHVREEGGDPAMELYRKNLAELKAIKDPAERKRYLDAQTAAAKAGYRKVWGLDNSFGAGLSDMVQLIKVNCQRQLHLDINDN